SPRTPAENPQEQGISTVVVAARTADDAHASAPVYRNAPFAVTPGKAFQIPGTKHRMDAGWKVTHQEYIGSAPVGSVTNVRQDTSTAFFTVKFLKGNKVLGNFRAARRNWSPARSSTSSAITR